MGISEELYILLNAAWSGCVIGIVVEGFSFLRNVIVHKNIVVVIEDMIFWIFTSVYVFIEVFKVNNGNWRIYVIIGIVVGIWSVHTIWCGVKKVIQKAKKSLKNKGEHRIIKR